MRSTVGCQLNTLPKLEANMKQCLNHFRIMMIFLCLFAIMGCTEKKNLSVGIHPWIGYEPLYQAEEFGWIPPHVTLYKGKTFGDSFASLMRGELDVVALTLDEFFIARAQGMPLSIITICDISTGADVVAVRNNITTLSELSGKRIGVEKNTLGELMLAKLLKAAELSREDVTIVPLRMDEQLAAWRNGIIDAAISYEPTASRLRQDGAHILFDSSNIPEIIFDVLAVRRDRIVGREQSIRDLLHAHYRALDHFVVNRQDALYRIAARQQIDFEEARHALAGVALPSLAGNKSYLTTNSRFMQSAATVARILHQQRITQQEDTLLDMYDDRFLPHDRGQY